MGEVYQANDTKLGRDVAVKVLPEEFAMDHDRVARFQREAKLLASLNHPNIAAIYGLEESESTHFLVMELIEGQTLKDRIRSGPIPVEEALRLALQVAEALEAAHENGVIHRDLKPANIKITPDGKVKILDFGLAKAYAGDQGNVNLADSPTISAAATQQGVILGTAAYMSPEQAKGKSVDKRADIWAFGCVLYEMLAGKSAFQGEDVSETLASVIKGDSNLTLLPANIHSRVREVITRCLQKDTRRRYSSIGDARYEIEQALSDPSGVFVQSIALAEPKTKSRQMLVWVAATLILLIIVGIVVWRLRAPEPGQVMRSVYELPEGQQLITLAPPLNISPDGKQIVYCTSEGLYIRSLDELNGKLVPGSDPLSRDPFFSPDGKSIAYVSFGDSMLKTIAVSGGAPVVLCDAEGFRGGSWEEDGFIVFSRTQAGIMRVSSGGGTPETLVEQQSEVFYGPQFLPDRKTLIYTAATDNFMQPRIMVIPSDSEEPKELFSGWFLRYLPSGHIVYFDVDNNLCAVKFDLGSLEAIGNHVPMVPSVNRAAISDTATLIYTLLDAQEVDPQYTLVWVDRDGKEKPTEIPPKFYDSPKISPDGKRIALLVGPLSNHDIWVWDFERKNLRKLTLDSTDELQPIWTPDSKRIIYFSRHEDQESGGTYWRAADGSGSVEKLIASPGRSLMPWSISDDGKSLLIQELVSLTNADISALSMEGEYERKLLLQNEYSEAQPKISPDGRLLAYVSSESSGDVEQSEVYICPFPDVDEGKEQVSSGGGMCPIWAPDGKELFYLTNDNYVMAVAVKTDPTLSLGVPKPLFRNTNLGFIFIRGYPWDIHPDGDRFLMIKPPPGAGGNAIAPGPRKIVIVTNWDEELKQRVSVN
jgi:serine/threonine-protein kinase